MHETGCEHSSSHNIPSWPACGLSERPVVCVGAAGAFRVKKHR